MNLSVIYLIVAIVFTLPICVYAWRSSEARSAKAFAVACSTSFLWMSGDVIGRSYDSYAGQMLGEIVRYIGVGFMPPAMLVFIFQYCGKSISRKTIALLCVVPIVSWLVLLTNDWHYMFFSRIYPDGVNALRVEYGFYFWLVHLPYSYALSLAAFLTVLLETSRASRLYRSRLLLLLFALSIPFIVNVIGVFRLIGDSGYTSFSFPFTFSIMAIAIFRYSFLTVNPIAYETVFKTIRDGVIVFDRNNIIIDVNPAAAVSLGKTPARLIGARYETAFEGWRELSQKYETVLDAYDEIELNADGKQHYISVTVTPLESDQKTLDGRIFTLRDITDRKQQQFSLETLAFHDPLTRLANRYKFQEEVETALKKFQQTKEPFAILYFDLNRFKAVNDTMGHEIGDELLKYVAARVSSVLRKPDLLARLGGDEFAALIHDCGADDISPVVKRLLDNVQRPFKVGGHTLVADLSIGAAFYPEDGKNLTELLRRADSAMYQAKQNGGGLAPINPEIEISNHLSM